MKRKTKVIASQITDMENIVIDATDGLRDRLDEEILNAQFELKQLDAKSIHLKQESQRKHH